MLVAPQLFSRLSSSFFLLFLFYSSSIFTLLKLTAIIFSLPSPHLIITCFSFLFQKKIARYQERGMWRQRSGQSTRLYLQEAVQGSTRELHGCQHNHRFRRNATLVNKTPTPVACRTGGLEGPARYTSALAKREARIIRRIILAWRFARACVSRLPR